MVEDNKELSIIPVFNYLLKDGKIHSLEELVNSYSEEIVKQKDSLGRITPFGIHRVCKKLLKQGLIIEPEKFCYQATKLAYKMEFLGNLGKSHITHPVENMYEIFNFIEELKINLLRHMKDVNWILNVIGQDYMRE